MLPTMSLIVCLLALRTTRRHIFRCADIFATMLDARCPPSLIIFTRAMRAYVPPGTRRHVPRPDYRLRCASAHAQRCFLMRSVPRSARLDVHGGGRREDAARSSRNRIRGGAARFIAKPRATEPACRCPVHRAFARRPLPPFCLRRFSRR